MQFIEGERVDIGRTGDAVACSTADVEKVAKEIHAEMRKKIVDTELVADRLVTLKRIAARNRKVIADLRPRQEANERNAEDPAGYMENFYSKFPAVPNPVDSLPGFRTDSEQAMARHDDQEMRRERDYKPGLTERAAGQGPKQQRARLKL